MKEKLYKRFIKCSQKITYYQEVSLTKEELKMLEAAQDRMDINPWDKEDDGAAYNYLELNIDNQEVFDADQCFEDFELLKK
jgi:hypothetical protein